MNLISQLKFETERLLIEDWESILSASSRRTNLERALKCILTPTVLYRLPLSMSFSPNKDSISEWVDERTDEVQVLSVHVRETAELAGLVLLFENPEQTKIQTFQLGYILGEQSWGKGYATEMVKGLISALESGPKTRLAAGVDRDNIASVGVLEKSGFKKIPELTTAGRFGFELTIN